MGDSHLKPFDLTGRRILISGAAGGIGSEVARLCAGQGASLVLVDCADISTIRERVGEDIAKRSTLHSIDTSSRTEVTELSRQVGAIYGLIDTVGICPMDDWMADDWDASLDRVLSVNIKTPINLTRAFFPAMQAQGEGRIVLCGSVAGWMGGVQSGPHYAFSKGGLHAFVRWLARRGAPSQVLVNGIAPGPVETAMTAGGNYNPDAYPLKRMAEPFEIASMAVFLCCPGASYASGAIFDITGAIHYR